MVSQRLEQVSCGRFHKLVRRINNIIIFVIVIIVIYTVSGKKVPLYFCL